MSKAKVGDRVRFAKAHHAMKTDLERREGHLGKVIQAKEKIAGFQNWALVKFEDGDTFWIRQRRLEVLDDD